MLAAPKTYKLFIDGKFPRTESGRSLPVEPVGGGRGTVFAHVCHASRKDLRDAVEAARKAQPGWANATAYNRGQILYRLAEMLEARRAEFAELITMLEPPRAGRTRGSGARAGTRGARRVNGNGAIKMMADFSERMTLEPEVEVRLAVDRLIAFAGWADKLPQVLGHNNPVSGAYYNFSAPEAVGVVGVVAPLSLPLLGWVALTAPALAAGNTVVTLSSADDENSARGAAMVVAASLGEVIATSDVPPGVVNVLTGPRREILPWIAEHRDVDAVLAAGLKMSEAGQLRMGVAENLKRVTVRDLDAIVDPVSATGPGWFQGLTELKTIWHPVGM